MSFYSSRSACPQSLELEFRTTGGHPDSLTSVFMIDFMTTTVLATEKPKTQEKIVSPE